MGNIAFYDNLREFVGHESKDTIWRNAELIYEQCCDKRYLDDFSNQQEFAEYLGITKGRISQYRYAYEYCLLYQDKIDLRSFTVEQVYALYRNIGSRLFDFIQWVKIEKKIIWEEIRTTELNKLIKEYHDSAKKLSNNFTENMYNVTLTEQERKIIDFYRKGTDEQKELINAIILDT